MEIEIHTLPFPKSREMEGPGRPAGPRAGGGARRAGKFGAWVGAFGRRGRGWEARGLGVGVKCPGCQKDKDQDPQQASPVWGDVRAVFG